MNEFGSLSTVLEKLAPIVEPEESAWDDVLSRAAQLRSEPDRRPDQARSARQRKLIAVLAVLAATAVAASALAAAGVNPLTALLNSWSSPGSPGFLSGTYSATLSGLTPPGLNGHWTINFAQTQTANGYASGNYGNYVISHNGKVRERGTYGSASGLANFVMRDTGGPGACDTPPGGGYEIKYNSSTLLFKAVIDPCSGRRIVLSAKLFTR